MTGLMKFMSENFLHVAPILAVGVLAIAIIVERARALLEVPDPHNQSGFFETIRALVLADRVSEAIAFCDRYKGKPAASVVREGLLRAHHPDEVIEHGLEIAVSEASDRVKARTGFVSTIANVATLLGLLGTILGLVQSFEAVGNANAQMRSAVLGAGISTAMNATMLGLAVAIPCMLAYSYLIYRTNRLVAELKRAAVRTLDFLKLRYLGEEARLAPAAAAAAVQPRAVAAAREAGMRIPAYAAEGADL